MTTPGHTISPSRLPETITAYLTAHRARDVGTAINYFTEDATVADEGNTHRGLDRIRDWLERSAGEYSYTIELTGARQERRRALRRDPAARRQLPRRRRRSPFPVTLRDGRIAQLTIEP